MSNVDVSGVVGESDVMMTCVNVFRTRMIYIVFDVFESQVRVGEDESQLLLWDVDRNEELSKELGFFGSLGESEIFAFHGGKGDGIGLLARRP